MARLLACMVVSLAALVAACGANVVDPPSGEGGGGDCRHTEDRFTFTLTTWEGQLLDCQGVGNDGSETFTIQGSITPVPSGFEIDSCPPNADCAPMISTLFIDSPGFAAQVPAGSFVEVIAVIRDQWGCAMRLLVRNLPVWGGVPSTGGPLPKLWFAGTDGAPNTPEDWPVTAESHSLGCYTGEDTGCGRAEDFALRFWSTEIPGDPGLVVRMGDTALWQVTDQGEPASWLVRNLRSSTSGYCDTDWSWAWWVVYSYPPD